MASHTKTITIDLLRHGEPDGGDVLRGRVDHPLSVSGWQQMQQAVQDAQPWTHIISSPLSRCSAFAQQIAKQHHLELDINDAWQEIDYGDWDGMPLREWRAQAAAMFEAFRQDMHKLQPPNGENFVTFKDRVLQAWSRLQELPDGSRVLLVTHGGVLRVVLPTVLGMPLNQSQPLHIPFASYSRVNVRVGSSHTAATLIFHNRAD